MNFEGPTRPTLCSRAAPVSPMKVIPTMRALAHHRCCARIVRIQPPTVVCSECDSPIVDGADCGNCATAVIPGDAPHFIPGAPQIDGYSITKLLGAGGMGAVYLAEDLTLRRKVAIKVIRAGSNRGQLGERLVRKRVRWRPSRILTSCG